MTARTGPVPDESPDRSRRRMAARTGAGVR